MLHLNGGGVSTDEDVRPVIELFDTSGVLPHSRIQNWDSLCGMCSVFLSKKSIAIKVKRVRPKCSSIQLGTLTTTIRQDLAHRFVHDQVVHQSGILRDKRWRRPALAVVLAVFELDITNERPGARVLGAVVTDTMRIDLRCMGTEVGFFSDEGTTVNLGGLDIGV